MNILQMKWFIIYSCCHFSLPAWKIKSPLLLFQIKTIQTKGIKTTPQTSDLKNLNPQVFQISCERKFFDSSIIILFDPHMISAYILLNIIAPVQSLRVKGTHFCGATHPSHSINSNGNSGVAKCIWAFFLFSLAQNWVVHHSTFFSLHVK